MAETITATTVLENRQDLLAVWQSSHEKWQQTEEYLAHRHYIQMVHEAKPRYRNYAQSKIQGLADSLITTEPEVTREPNGDGEIHKKKADDSEKWGMGALRQIAVNSGMIPPFRAAALNISTYGYTNMVFRWDETLWPTGPLSTAGEEEKKKWDIDHRFLCPFIIECPHPARILLPPHEQNKITLAVESCSLYGWDVKRLYPQVAYKVNKDRKVYDMVIQTTEQEIVIVVEGVEVEHKSNIYGFVPYVQRFSGRGQEKSPTYPGASTPENLSLGARPEDLAVGLLDGCWDSVTALDEAFTAKTYFAVISPVLTILTEGDPAALNQQLKAGYGSMAIQVPPGTLDKSKPIIKPTMDASVNELERTSQDDIDRSTISGSAQGIRSPGNPTATGLAIEIGQNSKTFDMPMAQINYMAGQLLGFASRMTEKRGETVWIDGIKGNAALFDGNHNWKVNFQSKDEGRQAREGASVRDDFKAGLTDRETTLTKEGYPNATEIIEKKDTENIINTPAMQNLITSLALQIADGKVRAKYGVGLPVIAPPGAPPAPAGPNGNQPEQPPQPFVTMPGTPQEDRQVKKTMEQVPGQGMERVMP